MPHPFSALDPILDRLTEQKNAWVERSIASRISLLQSCKDALLKVSPRWAAAACEAKGISPKSSVAAEEWLGGPVLVMRNLRLLQETLKTLQNAPETLIPDAAIEAHPDGQLVVRVAPRDLWDRLAFAGFRAEVWMQPELTLPELKAGYAAAYRNPESQPPALSLVLGAGNVASIGPMDVLYKLFVENQVCLLKLNPVNDYLEPYLNEAFAPLIEQNLLAIVRGNAELGAYLVEHKAVDNIHITGSDRVHDLIVWGPEPEALGRKKKMQPRLHKPITSELGCVTPVIILPGEWSEGELQFHAENVATMIVNNASFNCNAAKLLVTSKQWKQREAFLEKLSRVLQNIPSRVAYYPGSQAKYERFRSAHPEARALSAESQEKIPWTTIWNVDPDSDDIVFREEAWCGVIAETALDSSSAEDFWEAAVEFCNQKVWGTLSCAVIVHPKTQSELGSAWTAGLMQLRYGSIAVNHWAALSYGLVSTTWGAHPGHTSDAIGSGIGVVHNALMLEKTQKSIVYGPFVVRPKPPWFCTHRHGRQAAQRLLEFEYEPSLWKFSKLALATLRG